MTAYKHNPTCIVPAAAVDAINAYFDRQGFGPVFSIPLVIGATGELLKDTENRITHYGTTLVMTDEMLSMMDARLAAHAGERVNKKFHQAMVDKGGKRDTEAHPYQIIIAIPAGQRTALIDRLKVRYPDADAKFFKIGLSATGAAPIQAYADWLYAAPAFQTILDQLINQMPRAEVFLGCRDGNVGAVKALYGDVKYQGTNPATRSFARVWINGQWDKQEVLKRLNLKIVP